MERNPHRMICTCAWASCWEITPVILQEQFSRHHVDLGPQPIGFLTAMNRVLPFHLWLAWRCILWLRQIRALCQHLQVFATVRDCILQVAFHNAEDTFLKVIFFVVMLGINLQCLTSHLVPLWNLWDLVCRWTETDFSESWAHFEYIIYLNLFRIGGHRGIFI